MAHPQTLQVLLNQLAKLPGLGPRSAQRAALALLGAPEKLTQLVNALHAAGEHLGHCSLCGNLAERDSVNPNQALVCSVCAETQTGGRRDARIICVVETVADIWALERSGTFTGRYHVLGGVVSALQGVAPEDLNLSLLEQRLRDANPAVEEVILALGASLEGQTTSHLVAMLVQRAAPQATLTTLAKGMPVGASVAYMDEGTLGVALAHRQRL
jgi:recombination protein RecR